MNQDQYIEHEVQIRLHSEQFKSLNEAINRIDNKLDNQFKWIIGVIITTFIGMIITKFI